MQRVIRETVRDVFGPEASVLLFGSRRSESARGGDIDLLVELPSPAAEKRRKSLTLTARLQRRLGDRRIDVHVVDPESNRSPVHLEALRTGVRL